jgi:hypothetical protein
MNAVRSRATPRPDPACPDPPHSLLLHFLANSMVQQPLPSHPPPPFPCFLSHPWSVPLHQIRRATAILPWLQPSLTPVCSLLLLTHVPPARHGRRSSRVQRLAERRPARLDAGCVVAPPPMDGGCGSRPLVFGSIGPNAMVTGSTQRSMALANSSLSMNHLYNPGTFVLAICQFISLITNRPPSRQPPPRWALSPLQPTIPSELFYNHRRHVDPFNSCQPTVESNNFSWNFPLLNGLHGIGQDCGVAFMRLSWC